MAFTAAMERLRVPKFADFESLIQLCYWCTIANHSLACTVIELYAFYHESGSDMAVATARDVWDCPRWRILKLWTVFSYKYFIVIFRLSGAVCRLLMIHFQSGKCMEGPNMEFSGHHTLNFPKFHRAQKLHLFLSKHAFKALNHEIGNLLSGCART
jgi:hypothetical protein